MIYDIAIIGLGPAGAILAQLLGKTLKVVAIDKKSGEDHSFKKPCGGLLAPDAQKELAKLSLTLPRSLLVDPQIFSVETLDMPTGLTRHYQRFYLNMDRHRFDMWLKSLIPKGVTVFDSSQVFDIKEKDGRFDISFYINGETRTVSSKYIVGADGANSFVRRWFGVDLKTRKYLSVQQVFKAEGMSPFYSCVFDERITDCYSWALSKDDQFIFGGAYPVKDAKKLFIKQRDELFSKMGLEPSVKETQACMVLRPSSLRSFSTGKGNVFLVGEAAGFISPSSLEGISWGIASAKALAGVINSGTKNIAKDYFIKTIKLRIKLCLKLIKSPFMYVPYLRRLVLKSGISSIKVKNKTSD